mmetsp:Transcript_18207/g.27053  ORF Transcript_18207/g.27053 Transcript_18207/m.27053 type:complete len:328 (-) Transcript_18207:100-1083(-)
MDQQQSTKGRIKGKPAPHGKHTSRRYEHGSSAIDDHRMIIVGGYDDRGVVLSSGAIFDSRTQQWTALPNDMPVPLYACHVVSNAKEVYVIGGESANLVKTLYRLSLDTLEWTIMAPMKSARSYCVAVLKGNYIYAFGGLFNLISAERYSIAENSWKALPNMPRDRYGHSAVLFGNDIFIAGGRYKDASLDVFDTVSLSWKNEEEKPNGMPKSVSHAAAVALKGRYLVVIGGRDEEYHATAGCLIYDSILNSWFEMPASMNMITARIYHTAAVLDGKIVVSGGSDGARSSASIEFIDVDDFLECAPLVYPLPPSCLDQILILGKASAA